MSNCETCGCQGNVVEVVIDTTQAVVQSSSAVGVNASPAEEESLSTEDVPP